MTVRTDDVSLSDDDVLLRRILDQPSLWFTHVEGNLVASSAAFKDSLNEVSVNVAFETSVETVMNGRTTDGLVSVTVGIPRSLDHIVAKTSDPGDPEDSSHRVICPPLGLPTKRRMAAARRMARASKWIIFPLSERT